MILGGVKSTTDFVGMTVDAGGNVAGYDDYDPYGQILPGRSGNSGLSDAKYKLRHPYYEIYVAEIPLRAGFTGKERDVETSLDYFGARYYDSWRVEDPALSGSQWLSVEPRASKYPSWSPYNYAMDNPVLFVDPHGDTIANIDQSKQADMMKQMNDADKKQYEQYQKSTTTYQFSDVYNGWMTITEARKYIGLAYVSNGFNLTTGVDCSGFVEAVLQRIGTIDENLEKLSTRNFFSVLGDQLEKVDVQNMLWGDIVKFKGHMGFFDPTPIQNPPEENVKNASLLSARSGLEQVDYGVIKWFGTNPIFYRIINP